MVFPLGPGKFYGTSLPRPRRCTEVKYSEERVDPPVPVMEALLSWASEAHWSMGGLSFKRHRLQGRIDGSVSKLRSKSPDPSPSPPPAPVAMKRRRLIDEDEERKAGPTRRRRLVKKLGDDFDRLAAETAEKILDEDDEGAEKGNMVKSKGDKVNIGAESAEAKPRSSPRLANLV